MLILKCNLLVHKLTNKLISQRSFFVFVEYPVRELSMKKTIIQNY